MKKFAGSIVSLALVAGAFFAVQTLSVAAPNTQVGGGSGSAFSGTTTSSSTFHQDKKCGIYTFQCSAPSTRDCVDGQRMVIGIGIIQWCQAVP